MTFIPQRLKNIFTRKSKKEAVKPDQPTPASAAGSAPGSADASVAGAFAPEGQKPPVQPAPPPKPFRKESELARYKQAEGYYLLDLDVKFISEMKEEPHKGRKLLMLHSREIDFYLALINTSHLAGAQVLAASIGSVMKKNFGMEDTTVYFRDRQSGAYIDARDDFTGLPPTGQQFQIVLIPKDCAWRPAAPAPRKTPTGTSPLLRPPGR